MRKGTFIQTYVVIITLLFMLFSFVPAWADDVSPDISTLDLSSNEENEVVDSDIPPFEIVYYDPESSPSTAAEWAQASFTARMLGDIDAATEFMLNATSLDPTSVAYRAGYSALLTTKGDYESAYTVAQEAITLDPESAVAWSALGDAASMTNRADEAIHAYEYALSLEPDHSSAFIMQYNIGSLYLDQNKFAEARAYFEKSLESDDSEAAVWMNKGAAEYGLKDYVNASLSFERALEIDPLVSGGLDNLNATREQMQNAQSTPLGIPAVLFGLGAGLLYLRRKNA